jgi:16S rRNA processing protein RimM
MTEAGGGPAGNAQQQAPADAIEVGTISGAWGIKGAVRVAPSASDPAALLHARTWWLQSAPHSLPAGTASRGAKVNVKSVRRHGDAVVAMLDGIDDRTAAQALSQHVVRVPRTAFPEAGRDESGREAYYWVDLIGCRVINRQGEALGSVIGLVDTGVHEVLRVEGDPSAANPVERLIPFVQAYVDEVSLSERRIVVDWGLDF